MKFLVYETKTLLETLEKKFSNSSKRTILNWIKNGRITIDNKIIKIPTKLAHKGQKISFMRRKKLLPLNIELLYEDDHLLIIDKPSGVLSVPKDTPNSENALKILRKYYNSKNIFAIHRIDKETSGLLIFAKSILAMDKLKKKFKDHDITRKYLAAVEKDFPDDKGKLISYLLEKPDLKVYPTTKNKGKIAITHFKTLHRNKKYCFLSLSLKTGRKHQIRAQLKEKGFPIIGDRKYGDKKSPIKRICLHAYLLEFNHPITNKKMSFCSKNIPEEFTSIGFNLLNPIK